ncbi:MAG: peptidase C39 family protein [Thermoplasmata archaeon]|nr:peptidase C39 family protein [Thermoplasmata archaeon]
MVRGWLARSPVVRPGSDMVPWARSWLFPFGMTESSGLAVLLRNSGANVTVPKESPGFHLRPKTGTSFDAVGTAFGHFASPVARYREWEARRRGVRVSIEPVRVDRLRMSDALRCPAIVMVDQGSYAPDPDFPGGVLHWVVVTNMEDGGISFHDPDLGPEQRLSLEDFDRAMDDSSQGIDRQLILTAS